ncbi:hypothetical protein GALMADRAFT_244228 [Galerina marginata CBS 339.88]|uniref:Uncharacterized protein n=1 Tax=Galerina marginata (strain CBS 339.88) TaxID=685588 RepID=A0A067T684_GALM3|nr:hypothetical protein GALMADRAFT_244228 [Galerina marginata CBS 339.88]
MAYEYEYEPQEDYYEADSYNNSYEPQVVYYEADSYNNGYEPEQNYDEGDSYNDGYSEYGSSEDEIHTAYTDGDNIHPGYLNVEPSGFHCSDPEEPEHRLDTYAEPVTDFHCSDPEELERMLDTYAEAVMDRLYDQDEVHPAYRDHNYAVNEPFDFDNDDQPLPFIDPATLHPMYTCDIDTFNAYYIPDSAPQYLDSSYLEDYDCFRDDPNYCLYPRPHLPCDDFSDEELAAAMARLNVTSEDSDSEWDDEYFQDNEDKAEIAVAKEPARHCMPVSMDFLTPRRSLLFPAPFTLPTPPADRLFTLASKHRSPRYFLGPPLHSHRTNNPQSMSRSTAPWKTRKKPKPPDIQPLNSLPKAPNIDSGRHIRFRISAQQQSSTFQQPRRPPRTRPRRKHPPLPPKQPQPLTIPSISNHRHNAERRISNKVTYQLRKLST